MFDQNYNLRMDPQKISYERCAYESVDEKSLSKLCHEKRRKKRIRAQIG